MITVSPDLSVLCSILMETLFYGGYTVLFAIGMYILLQKRHTEFVNKPMIIASVLMYSVATAHIGVNWRRLLEAFVFLDDKKLTLAYLINVTDRLNVAKQFLLMINTALADGTLIWRLYVVWSGNRWICVFPVICLIGTFVTGMITAYNFTQVSSAANTIFTKQIQQWGVAAFVISFATNIIVTCLIAGRVWYVTRGMRDLGVQYRQQYRRVLLVILESGAVYAFLQVIVLGFYIPSFPGIYFVSDSFSQIMAIVPTAIIVAVGIGVTTRPEGTMPSTAATVKFESHALGSVASHDASRGKGVAWGESATQFSGGSQSRPGAQDEKRVNADDLES